MANTFSVKDLRINIFKIPIFRYIQVSKHWPHDCWIFILEKILKINSLESNDLNVTPAPASGELSYPS